MYLTGVILVLVLSFAFLVPARAQIPVPISIDAEPRYHRIADKVQKICETEVPRIAAELGLTTIQPIQIDITDDMRPYNRAHHGELPEWGVAFAMLEDNQIVVDVRRALREYNSLDEVIPHELSHLLVHQRAPDVRFPLWFLEGLAQWQAGEWSMVKQWQLMQGVWMHSSPRLQDMYHSYPVDETRAQQAYRVAYEGFTELFAEVGFKDLAPFLAEVERRQSFEDGFKEFFGYSLADYQTYFQDDFEKRYGSSFMALQTGPLYAFAGALFLAV
ncbi:MAG TPA: hypothetical protein VFH88_08020, partial [Candidatus Krumholzibacteria bacterium]|nr:hypothetical protein [Candidatus Krumholzibacteria bacterium]